MLASELILDSFYLAGILDPNEHVDGYYLDVGLRALNDMISSWSSSSSYITFFTTLDFNLVSGQYTYRASKLPSADIDSHPITTLTRGHVLISAVKWPIQEVFTTIDNVDNYTLISGIPVSVYLLQHEAETELRFFPTPSQNMPCSLLCKTRYAALAPFESITQIADRAKEAVKYSLAQRLANIWQFQTNNDFKATMVLVMNEFMLSNIKDMPAQGDYIGQAYGVNSWPWWGTNG